MIFGVLSWELLGGSITELVIFNSIDNLDLNPYRPVKIKEIIDKYYLKNKNAKILKMLETSVYKKRLINEYKFISKLPEYKSKIVFLKIKEIYSKKLDMLSEEN